jgi:hypothetical protein
MADDNRHGDVQKHPHDGVDDWHQHGKHDDGTPCYGADHEQTWMGLTPEQEEEARKAYEAERDADA